MVKNIGITVEITKGSSGGTGFEGYLKRLEGLSARAVDPRPAFEEIHRQFLATEKGIFASKGGGKWAPLTARYLARKTRAGFDPRIERRTGHLAAALTTGRGPGAVSEISVSEAVFGTSLKEAIFAQRGSGRRRRRLVTIDARRRNRWVATIREFMLDGHVGGSSG